MPRHEPGVEKAFVEAPVAKIDGAIAGADVETGVYALGRAAGCHIGMRRERDALPLPPETTDLHALLARAGEAGRKAGASHRPPPR